MNIAVCVKQVPDSDAAGRRSGAYALNPADACALELALEQRDARVTVLTMGPPGAERMLRELIARGAADAALVTDAAFAGADTYATAKTLRAALDALGGFDLVLCGRRAVDGDTAQTGPELAALLGVPCVTGVTELDARAATCVRETETETQMLRFPLPSVFTVREGCRLKRPPSLAGARRARMASLRVLSNREMRIPEDECGARGSKTRVIRSEARALRVRHAKLLDAASLLDAIQAARANPVSSVEPTPRILARGASAGMEVWAVGGSALVGMARAITPDGIVTRVILEESLDDMLLARRLADHVRRSAPRAVFFEPTARNRCVASGAAALLGCALTADCLDATFRQGALIQLRTAHGGALFAEIEALTVPAMATLRAGGVGADADAELFIGAGACESRIELLARAPKPMGEAPGTARVVVCGGRGVGGREGFRRLERFADRLHAGVAATRAAVEEGWVGYGRQVGQTGATVAPDVYVAVGVSGAVQHLLGMARSGVVAAINSDAGAPIFHCADYGAVGDWREIIDRMEDLL